MAHGDRAPSGQFGRPRRDTVSRPNDRHDPSSFAAGLGLDKSRTPTDILLGRGGGFASGPLGNQPLPAAFQLGKRAAGAGVELGASAIDAVMTLLGTADQEGSIAGAILGGEGGEAFTEFAATGAQGLGVGGGAPSAPVPPSPQEESDIARGLNEDLETQEQVMAAIQDKKSEALSFESQQRLDAFEEQTQTRINEINESLTLLNQQREVHQEVQDIGSLFLESQGLATSVDDLREENPLIDQALRDVNRAIATDDPDLLDEAIDSLATLSEAEADELEHAFGRDRFFTDLEAGIRTQAHNLVEERNMHKDNLIQFEEMLRLESEMQAMSLWDPADMLPSGRGLDVFTGSVEPWLENNFNGVMTESQGDVTAMLLQSIWEVQPSDEEMLDPETGEPIERGGLNVTIETQAGPMNARDALMELAVNVLGFGPDKAVKFVERVEQDFEAGRKAAAQAATWKELDILPEAALSQGIMEVTEDLYPDDPETLALLTNSHGLYSIIDRRSRGDVHTERGGNMLGLGALPEYTYDELGFSRESIEGNAEEQLRALLMFIGVKYGVGHEGVLNALQALDEAPETWADPPPGGFF